MLRRHISTAFRKLQLQAQLPAKVRGRGSITHTTGDAATHKHRCRRTRQQLGSFSTTSNSNSSDDDYNKTSGMRDSPYSSLEPSPVLTAAWPLLKERFDSLQDSDGVFRLLTRAQEARFANHVHEKKKEKAHDDDKTRPDREAAVLMILCSVNGQPGVLYTKRANHMALHGGEISFPGGHFDTSNGSSPPDQTLLDTALREAHEELLPLLPPDQHQQKRQHPTGSSGSLLQSPHLTVLGQTSRIPSLNGTPVTPFLAVLWPDLTVPVTAAAASDESATDIASASDNTTTVNDDDGILSVRLEDYFPGDPQEVAAVFFVSLTDLMDQESTHTLPKNRFGVTVAPYFPVQGHGNLWGLTAYITQPVLHRLLRPVFIDGAPAAAAASPSPTLIFPDQQR
jgi:hypothetical protein